MLLYLKRAVKGTIHKLGYELRPAPPKDLTLLTLKDKQYYTQWTMPWRLFSPWAGSPDFQKYYEGIRPHTVVSPDRCYYIIGFARYAVYLQGDFAECGVYRGGTALLLCRILRDMKKHLYLFDSFQGLPKGTP